MDETEYADEGNQDLAHYDGYTYNIYGDYGSLPPRLRRHRRFSKCRCSALDDADCRADYGNNLRAVGGDYAQRQGEGEDCRREQHHAVHAVERLLAEQDAVENVEHGYQHRCLYVVRQERNHWPPSSIC